MTSFTRARGENILCTEQEKSERKTPDQRQQQQQESVLKKTTSQIPQEKEEFEHLRNTID